MASDDGSGLRQAKMIPKKENEEILCFEGVFWLLLTVSVFLIQKIVEKCENLANFSPHSNE